MNTNVGDSVGMIIKRSDSKTYTFVESEIKMIKITKKGTTIQTKKYFNSLDLEDVEGNTTIMKKNEHLILILEPVILDDELRERMSKWCVYATEHFDEYETEWYV